jgi:hypothetical protein
VNHPNCLSGKTELAVRETLAPFMGPHRARGDPE